MSLLCKLKNLAYKGEISKKDLERIVIIPKDATNGDVIKAVFPNSSIHYHKADELVDDYVSVNINDCDIQQDYSKDWWNLLYRKE